MTIFQNTLSLIIALIVSLFISVSSYGQNHEVHECQTENSQASLDYFKNHAAELEVAKRAFLQQRSANSKGDVKTLKEIPVKIHAIRYSNGSGGIDINNINRAISNINDMFGALNVSFKLWEEIDYIDDNDLMQFEKGDEKILLKDHYTSGILNIYFAEYLTNASKSSICGYSDNSDNRDIVVVKNNCSLNDSTLIHEIGHILSLVHTHGVGNESTELVDGSNCDTDGDGICDTPADPGLSYKNVDNYCTYNGTTTDANGDQYRPDTGNMMSYSLKACRTHFSTEQIIRMYTYFTLEMDRFTKPNTPSKNSNTKEETEAKLLSSVKLYPNPVQNSNIYLSTLDSDSALEFQINNFQGQTLAKGNVLNNEINVRNLPSGSYILYLKNESATVTRRFIK